VILKTIGIFQISPFKAAKAHEFDIS